MAFKLPVINRLMVELKRTDTGYIAVSGTTKAAIYRALSEKNLVRAKTKFTIDGVTYQVISYKKNFMDSEDSAAVKIIELSN